MALGNEEFVYRLVNIKGQIVSGYNKDTNYYTSMGSAKSARSQLMRYGRNRDGLVIQRAVVGQWLSVE